MTADDDNDNGKYKRWGGSVRAGGVVARSAAVVAAPQSVALCSRSHPPLSALVLL